MEAGNLAGVASRDSDHHVVIGHRYGRADGDQAGEQGGVGGDERVGWCTVAQLGRQVVGSTEHFDHVGATGLPVSAGQIG